MATVSVETARAYLAAGLSCLPAMKSEKRPVVGAWKQWSERLPTEYEVEAWFSNQPDAICIVAGGISGNLECIDFDNKGELFTQWRDKVVADFLQSGDIDVFKSLVVEQSPSGGYHVLYRCVERVDGNLKLARGERNAKLMTLIETRGEGGIFLCAPTDGYVLQQGTFERIPTISTDARFRLLEAARALNEYTPAQPAVSPTVANVGAILSNVAPIGGGETQFAVRPGDDFAVRGDIRPILEGCGWQLIGTKPDGNELWRRPGKTSGAHSATYDSKVFYVFSSNAAPFESERGYNRFQVYSILACGGDYTRAARELLAKGYGQSLPEPTGDLSGLGRAACPHAAASVSADAAPPQPELPKPLPIGELVARYPKLKPVLIHGFLRRGETMNIIAPPKTGKSWLVTDLALSVATGTPWFGYPCEKGKVLIIDNELHPETSASRIPKVVEKRGKTIEKIKNDIFVDNQRGRLGTVEDIAHRIEEFKPYGFRLIIIDAFYRALPKGTDENDNGTVAGIYNLIDKYAAALDCAFVLIHHTSKGNQSLKSVTDVGAGAGSQSRAADAHVILRRHKVKGVVVMESVVRSFPSVSPICLRWDWPVWNRDDSLNPEDLEGKKEDGRGSDDPEPWTIAEKLVELVKDPPSVKGVFIEQVKQFYGITAKTAKLAVEAAITGGFVRCERLPHPPDGQHAAKFVLPPTSDNR